MMYWLIFDIFFFRLQFLWNSQKKSPIHPANKKTGTPLFFKPSR